ncbi:MAG TPA: GlsB/YeaQ/YmgE family stress response membrane protein [Baekduia sp.]
MIGALILGLVAGFIGRALVPNDVFSGMDRGPRSWAVSVALGLVGALVGYFIFTRGLGIGDDDAFDLGGLLSAVIGVVIVLVVAGAVVSRTPRRHGHA